MERDLPQLTVAAIDERNQLARSHHRAHRPRDLVAERDATEACVRPRRMYGPQNVPHARPERAQRRRVLSQDTQRHCRRPVAPETLAIARGKRHARYRAEAKARADAVGRVVDEVCLGEEGYVAKACARHAAARHNRRRHPAGAVLPKEEGDVDAELKALPEPKPCHEIGCERMGQGPEGDGAARVAKDNGLLRVTRPSADVPLPWARRRHRFENEVGLGIERGAPGARIDRGQGLGGRLARGDGEQDEHACTQRASAPRRRARAPRTAGVVGRGMRAIAAHSAD